MHVHVQERRAGKVAAINEYLKIRDPRADVILMCSADLRVAPDVVERIAMCFRDHADVGMVGARPVPDNDQHDGRRQDGPAPLGDAPPDRARAPQDGGARRVSRAA